jgi:hypothetical protein
MAARDRFVAAHPLVTSRMKQRALESGEQASLAAQMQAHLAISRASAYRMVRAALDILGFGEPVRTRHFSKCTLPPDLARPFSGNLRFGKGQ